MDDRHRRAVAFERDVLRRLASRVVPLPFGEGMLAPEFDRVWDVNLVNVEHGQAPPAADVIAAADELLGPAGFTHRTARYEDGAAMDEVEDDFLAAGYHRNSYVVLALGDAPPTAPVGVADRREAPVRGGGRRLRSGEFDEVNRRLSRERPWGPNEDQVAMFVRLGQKFLAAGDGVVVGAMDDDGAPVGAARVYGTGPIRQVEEVEVLSSERGRGRGRSLMQAALQIAREERPDLVFLVAEADDWPLGWYERLGFVRIGRSGSFQRKPPDA